MTEKKYRVEHDSLGERNIPSDMYYGTQTARAIENFPITDIPISHYRNFIKALGAIKQAAAMANFELGLIDKKKSEAIIAASEEVKEGKLDKHFPVDVIQGGAGTSANMNANEVIANRALEILGKEKGLNPILHPNNHVNLCQSTNDVYPTAGKLAIIWKFQDLIPAIKDLQEAFYKKAEEFKNILKIGRTQLQEAVPMTLGQEFRAFGITIGEDIYALQERLKEFHEINMGATAIGTGYEKVICKHLIRVTGLSLFSATDLVEATSDTGGFVSVSSILRRIAVKLTKTANDLRLLSSGPIAGINEIHLPEVQPGSSIMPGKINPVIPEVVNQVCFRIIGNDTVVSLAASAGQMQLNAFEPIIFLSIFESIDTLKRACIVLKKHCIEGIKAKKEVCDRNVMNSPGLLTAFSPYIGYEAAAKIAKEVEKNTNKTVFELIKKSKLLTDNEINQILSPENMTQPQHLLDIGVRKKQSKKQ